MKLLENKVLQLVVLLTLCLFAIRPLFAPGFFPMHDDAQVARVIEMGSALRDGQFPVRIVDGLGYGYGYPLFNFYAPLPYYFGGAFTFFGLDALLATKAMMVVGFLLAGIGMYLFTFEFVGIGGAFIAALLYVYAPYHAVQLFVRGSVGELWAYGLLPFVMWSLHRTAKTNAKRSSVLSAIFLAAIILSHNIIGILTFLGVAVWVGSYALVYILRNKKKFSIHNSVFSILLALGFSTFFWLPALVEVSRTNATRLATEVNFRDHFIYLDQLWSSPWGFAGSGPGRLDGMSFMIGKLHVTLGLLGIIGCLSYLRNLRKNKTQLSIVAVILVGTVFSILMMLPLSQPIWELVTPLHFVQFPWRLLVFAVFGFSFFAGGIGYVFSSFKFKYVGVVGLLVIVISVIFFNTKYFKPQELLSVSTSDYFGKIKWETSKISDEYLPKDFILPDQSPNYGNPIKFISLINNQSGKITRQSEKSNELWLSVHAVEPDTVVIGRAYFPGWRVFIAGKETEIQLHYGLISFQVSQGVSEVVVKFTNTPVRTAGNSITLISICISCWFVYEKRKKIS